MKRGLDGTSLLASLTRHQLFLRQCRRDAKLVKKVGSELNHPLLDSQRYLLENKPADVFYILGGGASVNELTATNFTQMASSVSAGINFWPIHSFVPDILTAEANKNKPSSEYLNKLLDSRQIRTGDPHMLLLRTLWPPRHNSLPRLTKTLARRTQLYGRANLVTKREENLPGDLKRVIRSLKRGSLPGSILPDNGSSVCRLTFYALAQGFKKIVWVGVDQSWGHYFWTEPPVPRHYRAAAKAEPRNVGEPHSTSSSIDRPFSNDIFLRQLAKVISSETGVEIFVSSSTSTLSDTVPVFPWIQCD
ncbi:hypothetical protein N9I88_00450 [Pontimonas sp.]|nr:hypothetical protein [Pontimonas sp.]MDA8900958.1 hypothetical protein [Pontimonas sp.]